MSDFDKLFSYSEWVWKRWWSRALALIVGGGLINALIIWAITENPMAALMIGAGVLVGSGWMLWGLWIVISRFLPDVKP